MFVYVQNFKVNFGMGDVFIVFSNSFYIEDVGFCFIVVQWFNKLNTFIFINFERSVWFIDGVFDRFFIIDSFDVYYSFINSMVFCNGTGIFILYKIKFCKNKRNIV